MSHNAWPEAWTVEIGTTPGLVPAGWDDVTGLLLEETITINYGRSDELGQDETGTAGFTLDNIAGTFDPGINPNTAVRITATLEGDTFPVFYGLVESAPAIWPGAGTDAIVPVDVVDGMTLLARDELGEMTRPSELTGSRINALLDVAGWPADMRDIDTGRVYIHELGEYDANGELQDTIVNGLAAIREAVEVEQGQIYVAPDGKFVFHDRLSRIGLEFGQIYGGGYLSGYETAGPGVATTFGGSGITLTDVTPRFDDSTLWTVGRAQMADGSIIEHEDSTAVGMYGRRVYVVNDLPMSDIEADCLAAWIVVRYAEPRRRLDQLVIEAGDLLGLQAVLSVRPGGVVRVQESTPEGGTLDEYGHIEHIDHAIVTGTWTATLQLSPYFGAGPWLILDDPVKGVLDNTRKVAP